MSRKLTQMNGILEKVFEEIDDETLAIVMGDHGMDPKGDHGGDSENELSAGLYLYSKTPLTLVDSVWRKLFGKLDSLNFGSDDPLVSLNSNRTFPQIDINPTIALLAGLPIPFGNLGSVIPELFYYSHQNSSLEALENLLKMSRANAHQIKNYISEYSMIRSWASDALDDLKAHFDTAEVMHASISIANSTEDALINSYLAYTMYSRKALISARKIWARFDVSLILMGIFILISTVLLYCCAYFSGISMTLLIQNSFWKICLAGTVLSCIGASGYFRQLVSIYQKEDTAQNWYHHHPIFLGILGFIISTVYYLVCEIRKDPPNLKVQFKSMDWQNILVSILLVGYIITPASDSFTVYEDHTTLYLLQLFSLVNILYSLSLPIQKFRHQLIFHL